MWTASNFIVAGMESGEDGWNKPFLYVINAESVLVLADDLIRFTYLNTAPYALYLLPTYWRYKRGRIPDVRYLLSLSLLSPTWTDIDSPYQPLAQDEMPTRRSLSGTRSTSWIEPENEPHILTDPMALPDQEDKLGVRETAGVAVWWGIVWFIGNWLNNTALGMTSVASMTIIATTSGAYLSYPRD